MVRELTTADRVRALMRAIGSAASGPGTVYLSGGTSAVLVGWRGTTHDADLKPDPEPPGFFDAIPRLKERLRMNIELAAPDQFVPPLPGWRERSELIGVEGKVAFRHFDFYTQALSKVERDHRQDRSDVAEMVARGLVDSDRLLQLFEQVEPNLGRYPAIDGPSLRARLEALAGR